MNKETKRRSTIIDWLMHAETMLVKGNSDLAVIENLTTFEGADSISAEKIVIALRNSGPRFVLSDDDYKALMADLMNHAVMTTTFRTRLSELRAMLDAYNSRSRGVESARQPKTRSLVGMALIVLGVLLAVIGIIVVGAALVTGGTPLAPARILVWAGPLVLGLILVAVGLAASG